MTSEWLELATRAAREAGALLRAEFGKPAAVGEMKAHDIKLEIDVRTQELITRRILDACPSHAILGEEGVAGDATSNHRWIVDPLDGTVNYYYGIPHFSVSIALQIDGVTTVGAVYDPLRDEMWSVRKGAPPERDGVPVAASPRSEMGDAVLSVGFAKSQGTIRRGLDLLGRLVPRVKKCRLFGGAALDLAYVAGGRFDGYIESELRIWDLAAGALMVEEAGGRVELTPLPGGDHRFSIVAWNGRLPLSGIFDAPAGAGGEA